MKRRTKVIALATSLLVGVSMIGVGFASWVISTSESKDATGNVKAEQVQNNSVAFSIESNSTITFGGPTKTQLSTWASENSGKRAWLTNDDEIETEALTATFTFTFTSGVLESMTVSSVEYTYAGADSGSVDFEAAVSAGLITAPKYALASDNAATWVTAVDANTGAWTISGGSHTVSDTETVKITATYGWGEYFSGQNPYLFYNSKTASAKVSDDESAVTWAQDAETKLGQLYIYLGGASGATFTFTFAANA